MKRLILSAVIASATLTGALAQQNDQRLNKAITDKGYFQKAWKSAPSFRDLLKRRKAAVNQFRAIHNSKRTRTGLRLLLRATMQRVL